MLKITNPNEWIKNSALIGGNIMPHRFALSFYTDPTPKNVETNENGETVHVQADVSDVVAELNQVKLFDMQTGGERIDSENLLMFQNIINDTVAFAVQESPSITHMTVLVVHDDIEIADQLVDAAMEIPIFYNIETAGAISTNNIVWKNKIDDVKGVVDLNYATVFEAELIFSGKEIVRN